jgi:hypothetical protein
VDSAGRAVNIEDKLLVQIKDAQTLLSDPKFIFHLLKETSEESPLE